MVSAEYPPVSMASRALAMHAAKVWASLRHGITIETSTAAGSYCTRDEGRGAVFMALEPNAGCRPRLAVAAEKQDQCQVEPEAGFIPAVPRHATFQAPPSVAEERGWLAEGTSVPTANKSDPDGSPLENSYLPCGLFLLSRTFPSGPLPRLGTAGLERKPRKSVRRPATIRSLPPHHVGRSSPPVGHRRVGRSGSLMRSRPCGRRRRPDPGR